MKKVIIMMIAMTIISCKKKTVAPVAKTSTSTTSYTISPAETLVLGDWTLDSIQMCSNYTRYGVWLPCGIYTHLQLYSTQVGTSAPQDGWKDAHDAVTNNDCSGTGSIWRITGTQFQLSNATYNILSSTGNILIYQELLGGRKYHLHK